MSPEAPDAVWVGTARPRQGLQEFRGSIAWMAALPLLVTISLWPTAEQLWAAWTTRSRYSHGLLVLAMSMFSAWQVGRRMDWSDARPSLYGWAALLSFGAIWLSAVLLDVESLQGASIAILLGCVIWASKGFAALRQFAIPILLLLCGVPAWDPVADVLQVMSLQASGMILHLVGIPAILEGFHVLIPSGTFEIESGCSGIAYFIVALATGLYIGVNENVSAARTLTIVAVLGATAIVANWIRIVLIIYAGHATQMRHSLIVDGHYAFGWGLFAAFFFVALWVIVTHLIPPREPVVSTAAGTRPATGPIRSGRDVLHIGPAVILLPLLAYASGTPALSTWGGAVTLHWPTQVGELRAEQHSLSPSWKPSYPGAAAEWKATYGTGEISLQAYAACYTHQKNGSELVGYSSSPAGPEGKVDSTSVAGDRRLARLSWLDDSGARWIGIQTYQVGRYFTGSPAVSKLLHLTLIGRNHLPACTLIVAAPCISRCGDRLMTAQALAAGLADAGLFAPR